MVGGGGEGEAGDTDKRTSAQRLRHPRHTTPLQLNCTCCMPQRAKAPPPQGLRRVVTASHLHLHSPAGRAGALGAQRGSRMGPKAGGHRAGMGGSDDQMLRCKMLVTIGCRGYESPA